MRSQSRVTPYLFILPALLGLITFRIAPIGVSLVGSLTGQTLMGETRFVWLKNYFDLVGNPAFWSSLGLTLVFNLLINPFQIAVALALALLVFRRTRGVDLIRTTYFLPMTVSIGVASILWNLLLDPSLGLVNGIFRKVGIPPQPFFTGASQAMPSLIWLATWKGVGYWMIFLLAGLNDIPHLLYEAAEIDGARSFARFRYITLPLMKRPIAFVLVADTVANFLFFAPVYLITKGGPMGATNLLMFTAYQSAFTYGNMGRSLAISTTILLIIAAFAFVELKFFRAEEQTYG
jgi:multiple sugar transport system permease protein